MTEILLDGLSLGRNQWLEIGQSICYSARLMLISSLLAAGIVWHVVQTLPGFVESLGYLFGILLASFTFDVCFQRDVE